MEKRPRMLEGYRVLDFTHFVAGPTCTRILGEMGADVIKVERSVGGDHVRKLGVIRDGMSSYYFQHNHSKRSLAIDLHQPRARELILSMIPKIDVVVENAAEGIRAVVVPVLQLVEVLEHQAAARVVIPDTEVLLDLVRADRDAEDPLTG